MRALTEFSRLRCGRCDGSDLEFAVRSTITDGGDAQAGAVWVVYECRDCGYEGRRQITAESMPAGLQVGDRKVVER